MTDPYSVLGIPRTASDDDIKKAYRNLSRKYHPDANINNPDKAQAEAKFKEVQQAYGQIMHEKEYGPSGAGSSQEGSGGFGSFGDFRDFGGFGGPFRGFGAEYRQQTNTGATDNEEDLHMRAAANFIQSRHYQEALNLLNGIQNRNAQWYYYSALACSGIGSNVLALQHAREALRLDPGKTAGHGISSNSALMRPPSPAEAASAQTCALQILFATSVAGVSTVSNIRREYRSVSSD